MSSAQSICQEFCDDISVSSKIKELNDYTLCEVEELKCSMNIDHFTGLVERMLEIGYCCTQVQNDIHKEKCFAWFEPMSLD
jgi:hypothetical protein|tara:strand:+ start:1686 stop:1928 length:243 start_codon:yes stop_codon:yes gene_type:complete